MNWGHINASCKGSSTIVIDADGVRVATEGHIAFVVGAGFDEPKSARGEYAPFLKSWREWTALPASPVAPGDLLGAGRNIGRWIGETYIAERFLRCFGLGVTYTPTGSSKCPVLVHADGALIGAIMPMTVDAAETLSPRGELTDEEVFAPYANADNEWHLIDRATLKKRLDEATGELWRARERLDEAQEDVDEYERDVDSLRKKLNAMPPASAVDASPAAACHEGAR